MIPKGSRKNPFTRSEYVFELSNNNWHGGWVKNGDNLTYHTRGIFTYSGRGEKDNPVPYEIYTEMVQNEIWLGGWVLKNTSEKKYIGIDGTEYDATLGSHDTPWSIQVYSEMISNEIWEGGWIRERNGTIHYVQNLQVIMNSGTGSYGGSGGGHGSGSNSNSGSGSGYIPGSGSGSGELESLGCQVSSGNIHGGDIILCGIKIGEVHVVWTAGMTVGQNELSAITISIVSTNMEYSLDTNAYAEWKCAYEMSISATIIVMKNGKQKSSGFISSYFVVPEEYRLI